MRKIILSLMSGLCLSSVAAVGDMTPLPAERLLELKVEHGKTSKGKEKVEIVAIYKDTEGKRRIAYMTKSDYRKVEQAKAYDVFLEYVLVEGKTKMKIKVK